jgi:hypothetical protein
VLLFILIAAIACTSRKREDALQKWEDSLAVKESELAAKEKTLAIREAELLQRLQSLDSSRSQDTLQDINPALAGIWSVQMTCTETTCTGSAVGDTKNEQWELSYQGHLLLARAMTDNKVVRVYSGVLTGNTAQLAEQKDSTLLPEIKMTVRLRINGDANMEGEREIVRENCKIVYALEMQKQS